MQQIAVVGMSSFGYYLARKLSELGIEVMAIDREESAINTVKSYVSKAIIADATDRHALQQLGLPGMDVVVLSLGDKLEASILAAMHLKDLGTRKIIAKALSEDHLKILELIGVDQIVFPERDTGIRLAFSLGGTNIAEYLPLGSSFSIVEMAPLKEMVGRTLKELDFRKKYHCQVLAIKEKKPEEKIFFPEPDTKIAESNLLIIMGKDNNLARIREAQ